MNKELSIETLLFSAELSNLETRVISGDRLENIKQDTHLVQDSPSISGYLIQAEEVGFPSLSCKIPVDDAASGMISELVKT